MASSGLVVDGLDVPVLVINLNSRPDRWDAVQSHLSASGLQPQRIPALTALDATDMGYRISVPEVEDAEWRVSPGGLGCAASHLEVYRRVAKMDSPGAVIMEDDVLLADDFVVRAQRALNKRSSQTAVVSLGWLFFTRSPRSRLLDATHRLLGRGSRDRLAVHPFGFGTHCYWVSREFCQRPRI